MTVDFARNKAPRQTLSSLLSAVEQIPQVKSVAFVSGMPLDRFGNTLEYLQLPELDRGIVASASVSPTYFRTVDIPILAGRSFEDADLYRTSSPKPIVVTQEFVRRFYSDSNPLGKVLKASNRENLEIVGVARDIAFGGLLYSEGNLVYTLKEPALTGYMLVRFDGDSGSIAAALKTILRGDLGVPMTAITLESMLRKLVEDQLRPIRIVFLVLGFIALGLALIGVFGMTSFAAAQRKREIAIRLACGAGPRDILRNILGAVLRPLPIALPAGLLLSWGFVKATDLSSFVSPIPDVIPYIVVCVVSYSSQYWPQRSVPPAPPLFQIHRSR